MFYPDPIFYCFESLSRQGKDICQTQTLFRLNCFIMQINIMGCIRLRRVFQLKLNVFNTLQLAIDSSQLQHKYSASWTLGERHQNTHPLISCCCSVFVKHSFDQKNDRIWQLNFFFKCADLLKWLAAAKKKK